jgi:hypothetical protein
MNTITLTQQQLDDLAEAAAERAARKALAGVGLHDDKAADDVRSLRDLLGMWRIVRNSALKQFGGAVTLVLLGALALYVGIKLKIGQ